MTHACCPSCGLRFTTAAAAYLLACPECGGPPQRVPSAEHVLGFRLWTDDDCRDALPQAVAVATRIHAPAMEPS
jgi:predicted  nucleic acid-binding Zn-ribbon protein